MTESAQVVDESAFEQKSLGKQIVFSVITIGLYSLYWFFSTAKQLDAGTNRDLTPVFAFVPILNLICMWQISDAAEAVTDQSQMALFLVFLFFGPLGWYWVQSGMNDIASA
jgi:hypothetical protein